MSHPASTEIEYSDFLDIRLDDQQSGAVIIDQATRQTRYLLLLGNSSARSSGRIDLRLGIFTNGRVGRNLPEAGSALFTSPSPRFLFWKLAFPNNPQVYLGYDKTELLDRIGGYSLQISSTKPFGARFFQNRIGIDLGPVFTTVHQPTLTSHKR